MSLINRTFLIFILSVVLVVGTSYLVQYYSLSNQAYSEVRKGLRQHRQWIEYNYTPGEATDTALSEFTGYTVEWISGPCSGRDTFFERDDRMFMQSCMKFRDADKVVSISTGIERVHNIQRRINFVHLYILGALLLILFTIKQLAFNNIWSQFHKSLDILKKRELHIKRQHFPESSIREISELNAELNELSAFLTRAYQSQKEFIENLSHELFTPISNIRGQLELLLQSENLEEKDVKLIAKALEGLERLIRVNRALILLTKVENRQQVEKQTFSLRSVMDQVLDMFEDQVRVHGIELSKSITNDLPLHANRGLVEILLINLVRNSIIHNVDNGSILIKMEGNEFSISNTGSPHSLKGKRIFKRFSSDSEDSQSVGLGLAISKRICAASGISIRYDFYDDMHRFRLDFGTVLNKG